MVEEFNLSEKIQDRHKGDSEHTYYPQFVYVGHVKEFIKRLKKIDVETMTWKEYIGEINKLAGDKLTDGN